MKTLLDFFLSYGFTLSHASLLATIFAALLALVVIVALEVSTKRVLLGFISRFAAKTATTLDDILVRYNVFSGLARLVPPVLLHLLSDPVLQFFPDLIPIVKNLSVLWLTAGTILVSFSALDALLEYSASKPSFSRLPLKSFIQVIKSLAVGIGLIVVISKLLGTSPIVFLSGLGAFTAVLLLVFKDSILGLVAGIQLSANNLVRIGDWIEMPKYGADGDVIDISLVTVSVQNWDKTISTIPAYALISEGFKNWRGMSEAGGRRMKRSVNIDMTSVRFCDPKMLSELREVRLLKEYLERKERELAEWNAEMGATENSPVNARRLTNFGTFRAYLAAYLGSHPKVNSSMTLIIRHLQPTAEGIPLEIYLFSRDTEWAKYEQVQADIMDHVLSVLPWFDLRVFQSPGGFDINHAGRYFAESLGGRTTRTDSAVPME